MLTTMHYKCQYATEKNLSFEFVRSKPFKG